MKITILSMTCGEGHNAIAKALSSRLDELGVENKIVDIYRSKKFKQKFNNYGYLLGVKYFPRTYEFFWKREKNKDPNLRYSKTMFNKDIDSVSTDIETEINTYSPDAIVCTHCYASAIVSKLRHFNKIDKQIKLFSILTDFLPHPYWESSVDIDKVFIPHSCSENQLVKKGFDKNQLIESGMPIKNKFYDIVDKKDMRKKLSIGENEFVVTLACGGFGNGLNYKIIKGLHKHCPKITFINLNGKNKKSKSKVDKFITRHELGNIINLGFVTNVDELMSASDAIITKAGCVTLSEAVCKQLPIVMLPNPRINEKENSDILVNAGVAIQSTKISDIKDCVLKIKNNTQLKDNMKQACSTIKRQNSTDFICRYIVDSCK